MHTELIHEGNSRCSADARGMHAQYDETFIPSPSLQRRYLHSQFLIALSHFGSQKVKSM